MSKQAIVSPDLAPPVGPYSTAVRAGGFVFLSGQIGLDPGTRKIVAGGVEAQTEQLFRNIRAVLEAAGKTMDDVVRTCVYLTDMADFGTMNAIYARQFKEPFPARTTIAVTALPIGATVEIDLVVED